MGRGVCGEPAPRAARCLRAVRCRRAPRARGRRGHRGETQHSLFSPSARSRSIRACCGSAFRWRRRTMKELSPGARALLEQYRDHSEILRSTRRLGAPTHRGVDRPVRGVANPDATACGRMGAALRRCSGRGCGALGVGWRRRASQDDAGSGLDCGRSGRRAGRRAGRAIPAGSTASPLGAFECRVAHDAAA